MAHGTPNVAIVSNDSRLATTESTGRADDQVDPIANKVADAIAEHDGKEQLRVVESVGASATDTPAPAAEHALVRPATAAEDAARILEAHRPPYQPSPWRRGSMS